MAKIDAKTRSRLNRLKMDTYHSGIPVDVIDSFLWDHGFMLVQEDGTPFSAVFCGEEGSSLLRFATLAGDMVENSAVALQWYKMRSGNYEINTYVT